MTPLSTLIRVELAKLVRRPMTWTLLLVLLGISVLIYGSLIGMIFVGDSGSEELGVTALEAKELRETILPPDGVIFAATTTQLIGTILLIILAAGAVGSEFNWATFRTNIFMGATRARLFIAKVLALQLAALAAIIIGVAWGMTLSLLSWAMVGTGDAAGIGFSDAMVADALLAVVVGTISIGLWVLISAGITLVTHSLATGLGVTLVLSFIGGQIVVLIRQLGTIGEWTSRLFPNASTDAIASLLASDPPSYAATDWLWISANIVGWTVLVILLGVKSFRRMNLLSTS